MLNLFKINQKKNCNDCKYYYLGIQKVASISGREKLKSDKCQIYEICTYMNNVNDCPHFKVKYEK